MNPRVKKSRADECDELPNSIRVTVPPLGISVFSCTRVEEEPQTDAKAVKKTVRRAAPAKKKTASKAAPKTAAKRSGASSGKSLKETLAEKAQTEDYR